MLLYRLVAIFVVAAVAGASFQQFLIEIDLELFLPSTFFASIWVRFRVSVLFFDMRGKTNGLRDWMLSYNGG